MPQHVSRSFQARRALLRYLAPRYQRASPVQKTLLLDAFVEWTGYTRKYAIELLNHGEYDQQTIHRPPVAPVPSNGAAGPLSGLEGHPLCLCQTPPAVPPQPGVDAGKAGACAAYRRRAPAVAHYECVHRGAILTHPTQTPPAWAVHDDSWSVAQGPDPRARVLLVGGGSPRLCGNGPGAPIVGTISMGIFCLP